MAGPINPDTISFDAPVAFTDGSTLPAGAIARYEYVFGPSATGPWTKVIPDTDFTPTPQGKQTHELDLSTFAIGQWYGAARTVTSTQFGGMTSQLSNVFAFEIRAREPNPPSNFSIA